MSRCLARLACLLVLLVAGSGLAATELIVAGVSVPGLDQQTVAGVSYAPAAGFAAALGAELEIGADTVSLRIGATLLELRLTSDPVRTDAPGSAALNGRELEGHAALSTPDGVLLPVKTVTGAFGGFVTVLSGNRDAVEVRLPRARLQAMRHSTAGGRERLLLQLSAPAPYRAQFNAQLSTLVITFERTDPNPLPLEAGGILFEHAWQQVQAGQAEVRVRLAPDVNFDLTSEPNVNGGWQLVLNLASDAPEETQQLGGLSGGRVIIAHGQDQRLADLALALAQQLRSAGVEVSVMQGELPGPPASADLQLLLRVASETRVSYLGDPATEMALALAAQEGPGVAQLRREILLGLHGDLTAGEQLAARLQAELQLPGSALALPLRELLTARGAGVRLQLGHDLLDNPGLPGLLAGGLQAALEER